MSARIENWYVAWTRDGYVAPEQRGKSVIGLIFGSSKFPDGEQVKTGAIKSTDGRKITTASDEVYELGEPEPGYVEWMRTEGIPFDEHEPIKLVEELKYPTLEGKRPPGGGRK